LAGATNAVLKVQLDGSTAGPDADGLIIKGVSNVTIRGLVINRFDRSGIFLTSTDGSDNNHIEGNFLGTNAAGTAVDANEGDGVIINGPSSTGNIIGGTTPAARNLIAGNEEQGVEISASGSNKVQGNLIGTDKNGTADLGNQQDGIRINGFKNVVTNNIVAFNDDNGVEVFKSGTITPVGNRILSNSIFDNQALSLDFNDATDAPPEGREQDLKDPDTGPNNLQNFPVITAATSTGTTTTITGTLRSKPLKSFTVQLFSNPLLTNEGKTFLG
jgi:hypothetical protein